jgi:hypothetical protein
MCSEDHTWFAIFNSIKHCFSAGHFNNSLELYQQITEERSINLFLFFLFFIFFL